MSLTLRRGGSVAQLAYQGRIAHPSDPEAFSAALAARRFRTIENAASEEVSAGWCTPQDPTGDSFAAEHLDAGPATWLRMRTDVKKLPAEWLAVHRTAAEKAKGRALNARERRELKDDLTEKLLPRVLPKMGFVDALLFPDRRKVLLLSSSKSAREAFGKLWFETFSVPLVVQGPLELAPADDLHRIEKLEPTCWPGGGSHMTATRFGWLGQEFLLWLWFRFETAGGEFRLPAGRVVGIAVDDLLAFAPAGTDETAQTMRHGLPTRAPESRAALRHGHRVAKMRLLIAEGARQWAATLDGETLLMGSVKLPEDAEECESSTDRTSDRAANWLGVREIVDALYGQFLRERLSPAWTGSESTIALWMAS